MSTPNKLQIAPILRVLGLFMSVALLGACAPATSKSPTLTPIPKTITPTSATFTPQPTATITPTRTVILPAIPIPASPTPGADVITTKNAGKITSLSSLGNGKASHAMWSPNDKFFAIEMSIGGWSIYNAETWQLVKSFDESDYMTLAWSPDGGLLATASQDAELQAIQIYNGETLEFIKALEIGYLLTWSPNGEILAIEGSSKIYFYDTHSLEQLATIDAGQQSGKYRFSPDGKTFATVDNLQTIQLWNPFTGKLISTFENPDKESIDHVNILDYSPNGKSLLLITYNYGRDFYASVWDISTGKMIYSDQAVDAAFSPDGRRAAFLYYARLTILDLDSGMVLKTIPVSDENIDPVKIAYSPDGKKLISTAGIFDAENGAQLNEQEFPQFQLSPDGKILAGALWEKYKQNPAVVITKKTGIVLWDMQKDQTTHSLQGFYDRGSDVSFNHSGKQIASFDEYRNLRIHDVASGAMLQQFHFESDIHSMAFGPKSGTSSGYSLAVGEETGRIQVWDSGNAQIINTFVGQAGGNPVTISPNGQFLAYPSQDGSAIQISDILSGKLLRNLMGADPFTEALRFSLDGQTLVISSNNNNLVFWDTSTGRLLKTVTIDGFYFDFFPHTSQPVWTTASVVQRWDETVNKLIFRFRKENPDVEEAYRIIALSSDGRLLAAGTNNALIDIWDVETGKLLRTLKGHKIILAGVDPVMPIGNIKSLAFSPYNHILASSATDCTTRIWDADTGRLLQTFAGGGPLAFSPDGNTLAYVSCGDGKVYLAGRP